MIPLRIKAEVSAHRQPFVVQVHSNSRPEEANADHAYLSSVGGEWIDFETCGGPLRLFNSAVNEIDGDVLLVVPSRGTAHRLIRSKSQHNSLLVTERCDQLCVMCSQPPKKAHYDVFPLLERAANLAPPGAMIGITGGEPMLFKEQVFRLLRATLEARPDLQFHVLTNGQHFDADDKPTLETLGASVLWGIPLYASHSGMHDKIVGKDGAFQRLFESLGVLARAGASIELRTVLMIPNAGELPSLARHLAVHTPFIGFWAIMQLENIGYARRDWSQLFYDSSIAFSPVATAVDIARARGLSVSLYNFPLCTVPDAYRSYARASISDWKQRFLPLCSGCTAREQCGGFFEWYPERRGFAKVGLQ